MVRGSWYNYGFGVPLGFRVPQNGDIVQVFWPL